MKRPTQSRCLKQNEVSKNKQHEVNMSVSFKAWYSLRAYAIKMLKKISLILLTQVEP